MTLDLAYVASAWVTDVKSCLGRTSLLRLVWSRNFRGADPQECFATADCLQSRWTNSRESITCISRRMVELALQASPQAT
jgi:hypothetical protein